MEFLKNNRRFDFLYGGKSFANLDCKITQTQNENILTTVYCFADGLKITNIATKYENAYEWVNWLENTSSEPTEIISELYDACVALPLPHEEVPEESAFQPEFDELTTVYAPAGSTWDYDEFTSFPDRKTYNRYRGHIPPGSKHQYATTYGRSSESQAPFFNVHKDGVGYIFAIGWSGQWNCFLERTTDDIIVKSKIEDTHFRLLPGEKIRTSSFVVMPYEGTVIDSQNMWRRLVKKHFSLIGAPGRDACGPLCTSVWGAMKTESVLERIDIIKRNNLPFEYLWMDADWYGVDPKPGPDGRDDWFAHTGDWRVNPAIHPNGLKDVSEAAHTAGMKFLLWFEPERVRRETPIVAEHPEYFIYPKNEMNSDLLLDLGNPDAWAYCFDTLSQAISDIGIDCYRQDFNFLPLSYWRKNDTEDRKGISEIKHITGMYRLWDALLEKFPHLLIDNCASGGKRIDIETSRRSIPLWRTDYNCPGNPVPEGVQSHNLSFNTWMPYSGTGTGQLYDTYRVRGSYGSALVFGLTDNLQEPFGKDPQKIEWLKKQVDEYLKVRPYMSEDFYPLTQVTDRSDTWCAAQFDRPDQGDGIVQVFRREKSPYETAAFCLHNMDENCQYIFTDADDDSEIIISGKDLTANGFSVEIKEKRTAKLYFYKKK